MRWSPTPGGGPGSPKTVENRGPNYPPQPVLAGEGPTLADGVILCRPRPQAGRGNIKGLPALAVAFRRRDSRVRRLIIGRGLNKSELDGALVAAVAGAVAAQGENGVGVKNRCASGISIISGAHMLSCRRCRRLLLGRASLHSPLRIDTLVIHRDGCFFCHWHRHCPCSRLDGRLVSGERRCRSSARSLCS